MFDVDTTDVGELWDGKKPFGSYLVLAAAATGVPVLIAELARRWNRSAVRKWVLRRGGVSAVHKTPSGWEHFFLQGRWAYVRATLKDGRVVGGFFGPASFAGYTAETPDLYLEQRYQLRNEDFWFDGPAPGTLGLYIRADEIVSVELYEAGAPAATLSGWRRLWRRISGHGNDSPQPAADDAGAADPQERRDHSSGPGSAASDAPAAGAERREGVGPPERS